ncbi:F-box protein CPR30-like [Prunus yedoensis var. nudiflora]|uniref:F-box protein CPR30-like n=1 Tax=Prunus yedoensis var. nudiflora TaxID=2094558 RepID=A0A314ZKJ0_PRUYE|nr:F-box protein CPR30-like [Prunus yedoensis var. nudiflora]
MDSTSSSKLTFFPEEIVREILLRLPAKSLIMCTAVCKSWSFLIKSCNFIDAHLSHKLSFQSNHQIVDGCQVFLLENYTKFNLLSYYGDILLPNPIPNLALPGGGADYITELMNPPILKENTCFDRVQTRNGLICLTCTEYDIAGGDIFIWNPSIRRYVVLPRPNFIVYLKNYNIDHYFGYDSHTNDYKVLRCVINYSELVAVEIYSLARGSWKTLTASVPTYFASDTWCFCYWVVVNDTLHWVRTPEKKGKDMVIVSFDISTELFGEIMMPQGVRKPEYRDCNVRISKHKGSVALFVISQTQLHLWVMAEASTRLFLQQKNAAKKKVSETETLGEKEKEIPEKTPPPRRKKGEDSLVC